MAVKASDRCDGTSTVTILYITSSNRFLRVAAELDISVVINLFNLNIIWLDVLVQFAQHF